MRVGVAPGTTAFYVRSPDLRGAINCLNCPPMTDLRGPLINGKLNLEEMGICPPDPIVSFITNPFLPDSTTPGAYRTGGGAIPVGPGPQLHPIALDPYGTDSTLEGAAPFGMSWGAFAGVFAAALAGGGVLGWWTRKRKR